MTAERTPTASAAELQAWRTRALNILLAILAISTTGPAINAVILSVQGRASWSHVLPFLMAYTLLLFVTLAQRLDYRLRAWGLMLISYTVGALYLAFLGLLGNGMIILLVMPALGIILLGHRSGLALAGISLLIYGLFTLFAYLGWMADWLIIKENTLAVSQWFSQGLSFIALLLTLIIFQILFSQAQNRALERASRSTQELRAIRDQLQAHSEELDRYAHLLEVGSLVSRETAVILDQDELLNRAVHLIAQQLNFDQVAVYIVTGDDISLATAAQPDHELTDPAIIQQVIRTAAPQSQRFSMDELVHHEMTLPLQAGGRVIGALNVHTTRPTAFSEQEIIALQGMADLLALATENSRLLAETQASLQELDALYRHYTADAWQQFLDTQPGTLRYMSGSETIPDQVWKPLFAKARRKGRPVTGESGEGQDRYYLLALPIKLRHLPIGVVGFYRPAKAGPWRADDIAAIETVTDRLALAVDNVRLLEDAQRRAAVERIISEVTAQMRSSLEMETVLRTAAEEMRRALGLDRVVVRLAAPDDEGQNGKGDETNVDLD